MKKLLMPCCALLLATTAILHAQPAEAPDDHRGPPPVEGKGPRRPPMSPLLLALDTDHDGSLSAAEIANAPKALLTLDKSGDGQIDRDELRPPRPADGSNESGRRPKN